MILNREEIDSAFKRLSWQEDPVKMDVDNLKETLEAYVAIVKRFLYICPSISRGYPVIKCRFCEKDISFRFDESGRYIVEAKQEHEPDCVYVAATELIETVKGDDLL